MAVDSEGYFVPDQYRPVETAAPAPTTDQYVYIPIETQDVGLMRKPPKPFWKDLAFYQAVGLVGGASIGGLYLYRRANAVSAVEITSPPPLLDLPPQVVRATNPQRVALSNNLTTALELRQQIEEIFELPLADYLRAGWDRSRLLIDFTHPFNPDRSPQRPPVFLRGLAPKEPLQNGFVTKLEVNEYFGDPKKTARELISYLKDNDLIRLDRDHRWEVNGGRFNTIPYVLIYGKPRTVELTNERVRTENRVPVKARPLHYVISLEALPNREHRILQGRSETLAFSLSGVGITPYYKEFLARVLTGEMNGWDRRGNCYANDPGAPLWCEFERLAILQTALNRLEKCWAERALSRSGPSSWDLTDLLSTLSAIGWNNSRRFRELFTVNADSWMYRRNREFIDLAMYLPNLIPESRQFVHYMGFDRPGRGEPTPCLPQWIAGVSEGGKVPDFPNQIGYALFSDPVPNIAPNNREYCR